MIKEFFEIESKQKNTFLVFLGLFLISFLQLFIFKKTLLDNTPILVGLSLALAICWSILNTIPITIILSGVFGKENLIYENVIFGSGLLVVAGQVLLTYIGYKNKLIFEEFIDFVWQKTLIAYAVLFIIATVANAIDKKREEKK